MHFAKTYTQLLLSLPPELRDNAIEYRKLKKLINNVVTELQGLGKCFCKSSLTVQLDERASPYRLPSR